MLNGLDLFSGIGGLSIALSDWIVPQAYCEIDKYCRGVLLCRMQSGDIPNSPIWDDIKTLSLTDMDTGTSLMSIDIIYGGFPCQDISVAGHGKGLAGERSGLFFEIVRLAKEIKPSFLFLENVPAITSRGGLEVVEEITKMGYDCRWCVISAASIGALHRRERWFLLGYSKYNGCHGTEKRGSSETTISDYKEGKNEAGQSERAGTSPVLATEPISNPHGSGRWENLRTAHENEAEYGKNYLQQPIGSSPEISNPISEGLEGLGERTISAGEEQSMSSSICSDVPNSTSEVSTRLPIGERQAYAISGKCGQYASVNKWQEAVSSVCRVTDGVPKRVDRIRGLGNAVVPEQAKEAFKILMGINQCYVRKETNDRNPHEKELR